jgi:hypothetical protein
MTDAADHDDHSYTYVGEVNGTPSPKATSRLLMRENI